jgi:hypothetical protein
MGKIVLVLSFLNLFLFADELAITERYFTNTFISCHKQQQIPSSLIYKRYLLKYSTNVRMEEAMFNYLKDPKKEYSIMPEPFFLKFPMKEKVEVDDQTLRKSIRTYLDTYDMKKKLILE